MDIHTKSTELAKAITEHIQELAASTDAALMSAGMHRYLEMCARFHRYSPHNVFLILLAYPQATQVAGFQKWRSLGRYVMKGQKGIPILAPLLVREEDEEQRQRLVGFKVVYVFDISQTDGEPLPEPPDWKSPEQHAFLQQELIRFAEQEGIKVIVKPLSGDIQGISRGGYIELSPDAGTKTLIHELAHELMHQGMGRLGDKTVLELEAESVAYVVARHFGIDGLASPNYIALHGADAELIIAHLERIRNTAAKIIASVRLPETETA